MFSNWNGILLINKNIGVSSFGVISILRSTLMQQYKVQKKALPKIGHGGTLDPFATGLLIVLVGRAVKYAQYFLGGAKSYTGKIHFGVTTPAGDCTQAISQETKEIPNSLSILQSEAQKFLQQPYWQIPPMYSAKKHHGKALYHLARAGIEVERTPRLCVLHRFNIQSYTPPYALFDVHCSAGTYIRTLAQDFAKSLNTLALLETLHRCRCENFSDDSSLSVQSIVEASKSGIDWPSLSCWIPIEKLSHIKPLV